MDGAPSYVSESLEYYPPRILLKVAPKDGPPRRPLECQLKIDGTQHGCTFVLSLRPPNTTQESTEKSGEIMYMCIMWTLITPNKACILGVALKSNFKQLQYSNSVHTLTIVMDICVHSTQVQSQLRTQEGKQSRKR